ncbi:MAG: DUF5996 family protein [Pseudomonadota bacterium]
MPASWPDLNHARIGETVKSLHMWTQIVGKFRTAQTPWINHSWQVPLYVNARGFTTSLVPGQAEGFEVQFDFIDHLLSVTCTAGGRETMMLENQSVADFHHRFSTMLAAVGAPTTFHGSPNEVPDPVPFSEQTTLGVYNTDAAQALFRALVNTDRVFNRFRSGFLGKVSPVHFFWGSFDLAVTRFSGREAPLHPGGIPALPDPITREAYSHEVSSAGFWPGGDSFPEAIFYSYAYPTPDGFSAMKVKPEGARFDKELGEFVLPYSVVQTADDADAVLMEFLETTYRAAADLAKWDADALECETGAPRKVRPIHAG